MKLALAYLLILLGCTRTMAAQWSLDSGKDETLIIHGGVQEAPGVNQQSLVLDGESVIELRDSAKLASGAFTVALWFNPYDLAGGQQMLAGKNRYSLDQRQWGLTIEPDGKLKAHLKHGGWSTISSAEPLKAGAWHFAALVVEADKAALFLNGKPVGEVMLKQPIAATDAPITLGGIWDAENVRQAFLGALDECSFQPRAMNAEEIAASYRPVLATHEVPKLLAGWHMTALAREPRPNLLFLLTDDLRADDLGSFGNTVIRTPHLDSLAERGVRFTRFFVTSSICMASRASYFTGRIERSHGCNFYYRHLAAKDWLRSYPVMLKQAGYRTGFIGKFGVAVGGLPQGLPRADFDSFDGFAGQGDYFPQGKDGPHLDHLMGEQALRFLRGAAKDGKPFCLSISFKAPHDPLTPAPALAKLYENQRPFLPTPPPFREIAGLPPVFGESAWYARLSWQKYCSTEARLHDFIRQRYRLIAGVDAATGRILAELKTLGLADNTVVFFSSDNGYYYGEHGLNTKFYLHEESIRVPLIVMDPRQPQRAGTTVDTLTANIDLAPTLLDLADLPAPEVMQGRSLLPLLRGKKPASWREAVLCENLAKERRPMCDAIRTRDWKYIAYFETAPLQEELYHLVEDPHEQRNLASDPAHQTMKQKLAAQLQAMRVEQSGTQDGFPAWIQSQKENTANWQSYRDAYHKITRP